MAELLFRLSYVALWSLVVALYLAVFFLYRHFGLELLQKQGKADLLGPQDGERLSVTLTTIDGEYHELGTSGTPYVIFFAAAGCGHCDRVLPFLKEAVTRAAGVQVIVVYAGAIESARRYIADIAPVMAVADPSRELIRLWNIRGTPYSLVTDAEGTVHWKGTSGNQEKLQILFREATQLAGRVHMTTSDGIESTA